MPSRSRASSESDVKGIGVVSQGVASRLGPAVAGRAGAECAGRRDRPPAPGRGPLRRWFLSVVFSFNCFLG